MNNKKLPVLFLIFNREDAAMQAFESIRNYQPERLYIAADGPRANKIGEAELCEKTRKAVLDSVDWECEVRTLFREQNLGCAKAVYEAITWFFDNEEYGIIIEDDVVIHPDFYRLCEQFLPFYKDEEKVMLITAQNHSPDLKHTDRLVFTNCTYIWGWASWRRAWKKMDITAGSLTKHRMIDLIKAYGIVQGFYLYWAWHKSFDNKTLCWDSCWKMSVLQHQGLCLSSNVCLSKNVGIECGGAHFEAGATDIFADIPFGSIKFPIAIPEKIELTRAKHRADQKEFLRIRWFGLKKKVKNILPIK